MFKINLAPRFGSIKFWLALGPAIFLLIQAIAAPFGYKIDLSAFGVQWAAVVNAAASLLMLVGVVVDPTTAGAGDSDQALAYGSLLVAGAAKRADDQAKAKAAEKKALVDAVLAAIKTKDDAENLKEEPTDDTTKD